MPVSTRWSVALSAALVACGSSSTNNTRGADGGSGGGSASGGNSGSGSSGGSSGSGGSAGSSSGGLAGTATGGGGVPNNCAGDDLTCWTCCAAAAPNGYGEFLDEFAASECGVESCTDTCMKLCKESPPVVTSTCAQCIHSPGTQVLGDVKDKCLLGSNDDCLAFAACFETCQ